ncbi:hypothetical protein AgCh_019794 [Apium graveolens]
MAKDGDFKLLKIQNQKQKANCIKDDKNNNKGQKKQQKLSNLRFLEEDKYFGEEDEEEELKRLNFLVQQNAEANHARQMLEAVQNMPQNKAKMDNQGGKRGNQNQNAGVNVNASGGIDTNLLAAMMNNPGGIGRGGVPNDVNSMMMENIAAAPGGIYQMQPNDAIQGGSSSGLNFSNHPEYNINYPQQFNNPAAAAMLVNLQNRQVMMQPQAQAQMMLQRSSVVPPSTTGYYYNYNPGPYPPYNEPIYYTSTGAGQSASHLFSDENTSSCSIM